MGRVAFALNLPVEVFEQHRFLIVLVTLHPGFADPLHHEPRGVLCAECYEKLVLLLLPQ